MNFLKHFIIVPCLIFIGHKYLCAQSNERPINIITAAVKNESNNAFKANFLLELALAYVHKPGEEKNDLDTALLLIKQAENSNDKILHDKLLKQTSFLLIPMRTGKEAILRLAM